MKEFTISGDIPCSNIEKIRASIIEALKPDKIKLSEQDIYLENDIFSLYIFINDILDRQ